MLGTTYNVTANYEADTAGAMRSVRRLRKESDELGRTTSRVTGLLGSMGKAAAVGGGLALAGGLAMAARSAFTLQEQVKEAQASLATVFKLNGLNTFQSGMRRATSLIERFRKTAAVSPGDEFDFLNIAQSFLPALAKINPDDQMINQLAARGTGAAFSLMRGDTDQAGMDIQRILSGSAAMGENRLFTLIGSQLMSNAGVSDVEGLNTMAKSGAEGTRRVAEALLKTLEAMDDANAQFADSWRGQFATLMSSAKNFLLNVSDNVFGSIVERLKSINAWIGENEDRVSAWADSIGGKLVWAFERAADAAMLVVENISLIATTGAAAGIAGMLGGDQGVGVGAQRLSSGVDRAIGLPKEALLDSFTAPFTARRSGNVGDYADAMSRMRYRSAGGLQKAAMAIGYRGKQAGRGLLNAATFAGTRSSPAWGIATKTQKAGMLARAPLKGAGSLLGGLAGAGPIKGLTAALGGLASTLGPIILAVGAVVSVMDVLKDQTNEVGQFFWHTVEELRGALDQLATAFGFGSGEGGFMGLLGSLKTAIGEGLTLALSGAVIVITSVVNAFNWLVDVLREGAAFLAEIAMQWERGGGGITGLTNIDVGLAAERAGAFADRERKKAEREAKALADQRKKDEEEVKKTGKDEKPVQKISVELKQEIHTEANIDRIAYETSKLLADATNWRRLSPARGPQ